MKYRENVIGVDNLNNYYDEKLKLDRLKDIEQKIRVIPNARATAITMNRDKIRDLASVS